MEIKQNKLPQAQIEVNFELTAQEFEENFNEALEFLKKKVKVDGFRLGQVPRSLLEEKIGKENLLAEAGEYIIKKFYIKFLNENELEPIGQPEVSIEKIALGSPFIFKIRFFYLPHPQLPNYREIARSVARQEVFVNEQEVQDALNYLQRSRAKMTIKEGSAEKKDWVEITYQSSDINAGKEIKDGFILGEGGFIEGFEDNIVGMKIGEEKEFKLKIPSNSIHKNLAGKESPFKVKINSIQKMELPSLDDEFAKSLGRFGSLEELKKSIKEGLLMEKTEAEKTRRRREIIKGIIAQTNFDIPPLLIKYEKEKLMNEFKDKLQEMKIDFNDYLSTTKNTQESFEASFEKEAENRAKEFLVLKEIGTKEGIQVSNQEIEEEINKWIKNFTMDQVSKIDINRLKEYTKSIIEQEKIFQLLENLS